MDSHVKPGSRKGRLNYDAEFKRKLAAATCEAGVSVARLALDHDINANMLHKWRRRYLVGMAAQADPIPAQFLPVSVAHAGNPIDDQPIHSPHPINASLSNQPVLPGAIAITFGSAIVESGWKAEVRSRLLPASAGVASWRKKWRPDPVLVVYTRIYIDCWMLMGAPKFARQR